MNQPPSPWMTLDPRELESSRKRRATRIADLERQAALTEAARAPALTTAWRCSGGSGGRGHAQREVQLRNIFRLLISVGDPASGLLGDNELRLISAGWGSRPTAPLTMDR